MTEKSLVALGLLGSVLDWGKRKTRWAKWRPTVSLCQHEGLAVSRFELLYQEKFLDLAQLIRSDIQSISPETEVRLHQIQLNNPWDLEEVYGELHSFARSYPFDPESEEYLVHITTGTHVAQICMYLLTESHHFPAKLVQTSPPPRDHKEEVGAYQVIDLDLSKYDRIASRFQEEQQESLSFLKSGIDTKNHQFNALIAHIEEVAVYSKTPILLMGPTGAGKSKLARRIYELKKARRQVSGTFVEVNCATLRGDAAMSTLFGHIKGAFTGAVQKRPGLLRMADGGVLFLDEIGELGLDEQAMLLRALEEKTFLPMGADEEVHSEFQLIAGTNRELFEEVQAKRFREDLFARINLWTFRLPSLRERPEDIEPNLHYELETFAQQTGKHVTFNKEAKTRFLKFATSSAAIWGANFRDLNAAVTRMATLAKGGRITVTLVDEEIQRLQRFWHNPASLENTSLLENVLPLDQLDQLDLFDRLQLAAVLEVCQHTPTLADAGRLLYAQSRLRTKTPNDTDRLRKYLKRFGLDWKGIKNHLK